MGSVHMAKPLVLLAIEYASTVLDCAQTTSLWFGLGLLVFQGLVGTVQTPLVGVLRYVVVPGFGPFTRAHLAIEGRLGVSQLALLGVGLDWLDWHRRGDHCGFEVFGSAVFEVDCP